MPIIHSGSEGETDGRAPMHMPHRRTDWGLGRLGELESSARLGGHTAAPLSLTARRLLCGGQCFSQGHFQGTWQRYPWDCWLWPWLEAKKRSLRGHQEICGFCLTCSFLLSCWKEENPHKFILAAWDHRVGMCLGSWLSAYVGLPPYSFLSLP